MRDEYHVIVRVEGETIRVVRLLDHTNPPCVMSTSLSFQPIKSDPTRYPITIYWKSDLPYDSGTALAVERAVLDYCARLYNEAAYGGPIDCCL
jgi:hypothetical protein